MQENTEPEKLEDPNSLDREENFPDTEEEPLPENLELELSESDPQLEEQEVLPLDEKKKSGTGKIFLFLLRLSNRNLPAFPLCFLKPPRCRLSVRSPHLFLPCFLKPRKHISAAGLLNPRPGSPAIILLKFQKQKRKNIRRRQQVLQNLRQWFLPLRNHLNPHP